MCLVVSKDTKEEVLKEDLIVYKVMRVNTGFFISIFQSYPYKAGKLYNSELNRELFNPHSVNDHLYADNDAWNYYEGIPNRYCYVEGFHSYITLERAKHTTGYKYCGYENSIIDGNSIVECTIPKGSVIVKDETGLAVSNQIIINKKL